MDKIRVAIYVRVSTDKDDQINSFHSQIKYFIDYVESNDKWEIHKVYCDEGVSGTNTEKRSGFNEMIKDALNGEIDLILTKEVSRFARNTIDTLKYVRLLRDKNVYIKFMLDGIDTSQVDGELRLTIMSAIAQEESRKISERVKWGQKRQMEKGVVFGRSLLGYRVLGGKLYKVEDEAEIVRLIFHKYVFEGKGTCVIASELNDMNITTYGKSGTWSGSMVLKVLKNEKYVGDLCQKKTWTKSYLDHKKRYNYGEEDKVYIKNHHSHIAIISRDIWDKAQIRVNNTSRGKRNKSYYYSGKIFCGCCKDKFIPRVRKNRVYWGCINKAKSIRDRGQECFINKWIRQESIEDILKYICEREKYTVDDLEYINVIDNNSVDVKFKDNDFSFRVEYKTYGKLDKYRTDINSCCVVKNI